MPQQAVAQPCAGGGDPLPQVHARLARADDAQVVVGRVEQAFLHQVAGRELPGRRRGALNEALMRHLRAPGAEVSAGRRRAPGWNTAWT